MDNDIERVTLPQKPDPELEKHLNDARARIGGEDQRIVYGINRTAAIITKLNGKDTIHVLRMEDNNQSSIETLDETELPEEYFPKLKPSTNS